MQTNKRERARNTERGGGKRFTRICRYRERTESPESHSRLSGEGAAPPSGPPRKKNLYNKIRILKKKENHRKWLPWPVCWLRPRRPRCCPRPARRGGCGSNTTGIFFCFSLKKGNKNGLCSKTCGGYETKRIPRSHPR